MGITDPPSVINFNILIDASQQIVQAWIWKKDYVYERDKHKLRLRIILKEYFRFLLFEYRSNTGTCFNIFIQIEREKYTCA